MRVFSPFDGISGARLALDLAGMKVSEYYASETEDYPVGVSKKHFPNHIHLGDIREVSKDSVPEKIDLMIGGSPCQSLSSAARMEESGLYNGRSVLFWEYVRLLDEIKPKYFLLENVASMSNRERDEITDVVGVSPIMIDSALVSAQMRKRYYWTNISRVKQPRDRGILLRDILEGDFCPNSQDDKSYCVTATYQKACLADYRRGMRQPVRMSGKGQGCRKISLDGKSPAIVANIQRNNGEDYLINGEYRKLTPEENEALQGLPRGYTKFMDCGKEVPKTRRNEMIGNGFQIDTVAHILSYMGKHGTVSRRKKEQLVLF